MKFTTFALLVLGATPCLQSCESRAGSVTTASGGSTSQVAVFVGDNGNGLRRPQMVGIDGPLRRDLFASLPGESLNGSPVSLSPNGEWLGTTTLDGRHRVVDVATGQFTEIVVDSLAEETSFRFGPFGKLLLRNAVSAMGPGEVPSELYIANADGSDSRRLGWSARQYEFLGWSENDGQLLTYIRDFPSLDEQWRILDTSGYFVADPLVGLTGSLVSSAWSDTHLAFTTPRNVFGEINHVLYQYEKASGQALILLPANSDVVELEYSPDSQYLTALIQTSQQTETVLSFQMDINHTFTDLTAGGSGVHSVQLRGWASDSSAVAFTYSASPGGPELLRISDGLGVGFPVLETGPMGSTVQEVYWSPNSRYLAFTRDSGVAGFNELLIHDIHSGAAFEHALIPDLEGTFTQLAWAPDSSALFAHLDPDGRDFDVVVGFQSDAWDQGLIIGSMPMVFPPAVQHGDQERSLIPTPDSLGVVWVQLDPTTNKRGIVYSDLDPHTPVRVLSSPNGVLDQARIHRFFVR